MTFSAKGKRVASGEDKKNFNHEEPKGHEGKNLLPIFLKHILSCSFEVKGGVLKPIPDLQFFNYCIEIRYFA